MDLRGYMLTLLVDTKVTRQILISGLIRATWYIPIIIAGLYVAGLSGHSLRTWHLPL
ncbi:hypothetical protein EC917_12460 [Bacillus thuringiensis]|uniref:Uncharacterized protein n=1 Tax=Bacillus thuringiensis TaxID=1428 RepID=A0A4V2WCD1_BACTU|nr:hypothetical protein EC917_12460 [Bacillus thuringiensis]TCW47744.1 hypothetical protein EC910_12360 [Bacillus thuringiensis]